jgi:hypothetical protein
MISGLQSRPDAAGTESSIVFLESRRQTLAALARYGTCPELLASRNRPAAMKMPRARLVLLLGLAIGLTQAGCGGRLATAPGAPDTGISGTATAGPVCPVERNPPDPNCAARPVVGATIVIRDASGAQVAVAITGADGRYFVALAPGGYVLDPQPVQGLLGTAPKQPADVTSGSITDVPLVYDTGIR